ncbi:MAG: Unknown protein [uncultured Sulfurovum sp.]|uniref:DUF302 domain-containing protein n=1 Tax=uncultured Sulfurovum sp. TaxID=269237 RepID=A0A6S6T809_9BACT|nr:MAG: Unknown protein [uncultured Sulfurovum sp.]
MSHKKSIIVGLILGLVLSLFVLGLAFKIAAPTLFFKEVTVPHSFEKTVRLLETRINKQKGWHVTNVIDQQKEVLVNGGDDIGKVKIIKFCNAKLSGMMLADDASKFMAAKMPLSIAVYEKSDGRVTIGLMNGYVMSRLFAGTREGEIMEKVVRDIEEILGFLHLRFTIF